MITRPTVKDHTIAELWEVSNWFIPAGVQTEIYYRQLNLRREALRAQYLEHYNSQNVDVVLCPVGPGPAPPLGTAKYWGYITMKFRLLHRTQVGFSGIRTCGILLTIPLLFFQPAFIRTRSSMSRILQLERG